MGKKLLMKAISVVRYFRLGPSQKLGTKLGPYFCPLFAKNMNRTKSRNFSQSVTLFNLFFVTLCGHALYLKIQKIKKNNVKLKFKKYP